MILGVLVLVLLTAAPLKDIASCSRQPLTTPFDESGNVCWEDELSRLDKFAIHLQKDETLVEYVVVYAGKQSCEGEANIEPNARRSGSSSEA
jgi:hypothetical protein